MCSAGYKFRGELLEALGRRGEAEEAILQGIELAEDDQELRFALVAISFARGDADVAMARLRETLAVWSEKREGPAGEPEILCQALWDTMAEGLPVDGLIGEIVAAYDEFDAGEELGRGLVDSIRLLADPDTDVDVANAWTAAWLAAPPVDDLEIPLELLRAASEWKKDRDRSHLLSLPPEQREILLGLLPSGYSASASLPAEHPQRVRPGRVGVELADPRRHWRRELVELGKGHSVLRRHQH